MDNPPVYDPRFSREIGAVEILIALFIIGVSIFSLLNYEQIKSGIDQSVQAYGFTALFLLVAFLEVIPQFINPVFVVIAGVISGLNVSAVVLVAIIASTFGSILGFGLGRRYGFKYVCLFFKRTTVDKIETFWNKYGNIFVFVSALTPIPYVPMIFGSLKMSWRDFFVYGLIPRIFNHIIYGYAFHYGFWNLI